jgi:hypothetical protein
MNITELDEWQGLTVAMLHSWLLSHGWRMTACEQGCGKELVSPANLRCNVLRPLEDFPWSWVLLELRTPLQSLLREINPRMRKGMPSAAAIAAHEVSGGNWLAQSAQKGGVLRVLNWSISDHRAKLNTLDTTQKIPRDMVPDSWCFWPCDEHGNKVRWPTDAEGKML